MTITVRLFASLRERIGMSQIVLSLPEGATVAAARDALLQQQPSLADLLPRAAFAVDRSYAPLSTVLQDGQEVAVIPPVSGG